MNFNIIIAQLNKFIIIICKTDDMLCTLNA